MDGLQRAIEETGVGLQRTYSRTDVGSLGVFGLAGLTTPRIGEATGSERPVPPTLQQLSRLPSREADPVGYRSRELEWRRANTEVLQAYASEWVVLEGAEVVAHGRDPVQVVARARARGIQTPYVFYVEPSKDVVKMGL
jgi:hypothetical protein